jgi:hypothetical protein
MRQPKLEQRVEIMASGKCVRFSDSNLLALSVVELDTQCGGLLTTFWISTVLRSLKVGSGASTSRPSA